MPANSPSPSDTPTAMHSFVALHNLFSYFHYSFTITVPLAAILTVVIGYVLLRRLYQALFPKRTSFINTSIVITGAGGAVGRQLALAFSRYAPLILLDINQEGLDATIHTLRDQPSNPSFTPVYVAYRCDITDATDVHNVLTKARAQLKVPVRIIINNAGIVVGKDIEALSTAEITRVFDVNVLGAYNLMKETLPEMKHHRDGCIVSVASLMSFVGSARLSEYCMSKWGLMGVMESLRLELGRDNYYDCIDTITVCPYHIKTSSLFRGAFEAADDYNPLRTIFYPSLTDTAVAQSILKAVLQGGHQILVLPSSLYYVTYLSRLLLPLRYFDNFVGWFGGWHGMSAFTGHRDTTANLLNHKVVTKPSSSSSVADLSAVDKHGSGKQNSLFSTLPIALNEMGLTSPTEPVTQEDPLVRSGKDNSKALLSNTTLLFENSLPMVRMSSLNETEKTDNDTSSPATSSVRMRRSSHSETLPTRITSNMIGPSGMYKARDWGLKK